MKHTLVLIVLMIYLQEFSFANDTLRFEKYDYQRIVEKVKAYVPTPDDAEIFGFVPKNTFIKDISEDYYIMARYDLPKHGELVTVTIYRDDEDALTDPKMSFDIYQDMIIVRQTSFDDTDRKIYFKDALGLLK